MARGKKKESALTPEEKLAQTLVPVVEQPYKVPRNWSWVRLGSIVVNHDAKRVPLSTAQRSTLDKIYDYYGASGVIDKVDNYIFDEELLLIGEDGANLLSRSTDIAFLASGKYWVNNHAHVLDAKVITTKSFLFNYINHIDLSPFVTGSAQPKLTQEKLNSIPIPLPPSSEQQRIVDRIEYLFSKLDAAKEKAQSVLDSFETRKDAILHKAFTGELTAKWRAEHGLNLDAWEKCLLGEVFDLQAGKNISASKINGTKTSEFQYPCFGGNGIRGYVETFNREGLHPIIGRQGALCGNVNLASGQFYATEHAVVVNYKRKTATTWAVQYLRFLNLNQYATATAQPGLAVGNIIKVPVTYIPYEEQCELASIIDSLFAKEQQAKEAAEAVLEKIDLLKKSILARAFRGELGTNDPSEESALELLKQVLQEDTPTVTRKRSKSISKDLKAKLYTELERGIIKLYFKTESDTLPVNELLSVSSKKFEIMNTLRLLEQRKILTKLPNGKYRLLE